MDQIARKLLNSIRDKLVAKTSLVVHEVMDHLQVPTYFDIELGLGELTVYFEDDKIEIWLDVEDGSKTKFMNVDYSIADPDYEDKVVNKVLELLENNGN